MNPNVPLISDSQVDAAETMSIASQDRERLKVLLRAETEAYDRLLCAFVDYTVARQNATDARHRLAELEGKS